MDETIAQFCEAFPDLESFVIENALVMYDFHIQLAGSHIQKVHDLSGCREHRMIWNTIAGLHELDWTERETVEKSKEEFLLWRWIPRDIRRLIFTLDFEPKRIRDPLAYFRTWSDRRRVCVEWKEWMDKKVDWGVVNTHDRHSSPSVSWAIELALSRNSPLSLRMMLPHVEYPISQIFTLYLNLFRDRLKVDTILDTRSRTVDIIKIVLDHNGFKFPKYFVEQMLSDLDEEVINLMVDHPNFQQSFEREEYIHVLFRNQRDNPNHQLANRVFGRKIFESKLTEMLRSCGNVGDFHWVMKIWFSFEGREDIWFTSQQSAVMSWITSDLKDRFKARKFVEAFLEFRGFSLEDWKDVTVKAIEGEEVDLLTKNPMEVQVSDLTRAIQFGYLTFLQLQLVNPFIQIDGNDQQLLRCAVDLKRISSTLILLQHPLITFDLDKRNELSNTLPKMSKLISILKNLKPNLNQKLILAVKSGKEEEISSVMKLGADPHAYNGFAWNLANPSQRMLLEKRFRDK